MAGFGGFGGKQQGGKQGGKAGAKDAAAGSKQCPCGSSKLYTECCQRYIKTSARPPTLEALLRARYSAFQKREIKYIVKTTHPDNPACQGSRTAADSGVEKVCSYFEDIATTIAVCNFKQLSVGAATQAGEGGVSTIDYRIVYQRRFRDDGKAARDAPDVTLHERASFVGDGDGSWLLLGTQALDEQGQPVAAAPAAAPPTTGTVLVPEWVPAQRQGEAAGGGG